MSDIPTGAGSGDSPRPGEAGWYDLFSRGARDWLPKRPEMPLYEALDELHGRTYGRSDWLLEYWSKPVLFSVMARRAWIDPDLKPLPF